MTPKHDVLIQGSYVRYKTHVGVINFVSSHYVTLLIRKGEHRLNDVDILIYPDQYNLIQPIDSK